MGLFKKIKKFFELPEEYTHDYNKEYDKINDIFNESIKVFKECINNFNSSSKKLLKTNQVLKNNKNIGDKNIKTSKNIINTLHIVKNNLNKLNLEKKDILDVNDFTLI